MATSLEASLKLRDQFTAVLQKVDSSMQKATKSMQDFKQKVSGPAQAMNQMAQAAAASVNKLNSSIKSGMDKASNVVKSTTERILSNFGNFGNRISGKLNLSGVTNKFTSAFSSIQSKVSSGVSAVGNVLSSLKAKISGPFNAAVSVVKNGATKIKNFLKQSGNAFKEFGNDAKAGMSKIESAFSPLGTFLKAGAVAGGAALVGLGKKVYDVAGTFDTQMSRVKAISGATGDAFTQMRNQAIELGAKTAFSATESAAGMENLASAGFNAQEIMAAMPGLLDLAAVSGGDVALASENAATALRGFNMDAGQAGHVANVFARAAADTNAEVADMGEAMKYVAPVANSMGLSIEEVAASIGIMSDAGVKGSQAGTTLRGALSRLAKPTKPMIEKMDQLGLSFYDAEGQMKPLADQIGMLQNAFKGLTPEQQQNALVTLYGQESLSGMMALVAKGPKALSKLTDSLKDSSGAAAEMAETMQDNLQSKVEQLGGAFESGLINIGDRVFPIVKPAIEQLTSFLEEKLSIESVGNFFDQLGKYGSVLKSAFDDVKGPVSDAIGAIGNSLKDLTGGFGSKKSVDSFKDFVEGVTDGIKKLANFAEKHSDGIAKLISIMPKVAAAFVGFKLGKGILTPFLNFGSGILTLTKGFGKLGGGLGKAIGGIFKKLPGKEAAPGGGSGDLGASAAISPLQTFLGTMNSFAKGATTLVLVFGVIKLIEELAQALKDIDTKVPKDLSTLGPKLLNMGMALTGMGAFVKLAERFSKDAKGAARGLAVVAGISGNLIIAALAMKMIDSQVPADIANFASKMANMGIAMGSMGLLVLAAGKLASMNPTGAIAGLSVVAGISLNLMVAAEAMKQVNDKVPDDIGNFASKVANIAIAIGSMGILVGAVGALMATGIGALIGGAGLIAVTALAGELMLVSEAIAQMDAKVPDDLSSVKTKVDNIAQTISYFTSANLGNVFDLFSNAVGVLNTGVVIDGFKKFEELANGLKSFAEITIPTDIETKVGEIQSIIESVAGSDLSTLLSNAIWDADLSNVISAFDKLLDIGRSLQRLEGIEFDKGDVEKKVGKIKEMIDYLGNGDGIFSKLKSLVSNTIDTSAYAAADEAFGQLVQIGHSLERLQEVTFDETTVTSNVKAINKVIEAMGGAGLLEVFGTMLKSAQLGEVKGAIDAMCNLIAPIERLIEKPVNKEAAVTQTKAIGAVVRELGTAGIGEYFGTMLKSAQLGEISSAIDTLTTVRDKFNTFAGTALSEEVTTAVAKIKEAIQQMSTITAGGDGGGLQGVASGFSAVTQQIAAFTSTAQAMAAGVTAVGSTFQTAMTTIKTSTETTMTSLPQVAATGMAGFQMAIATGMLLAAAAARSGSVQIVSAFSGLRGQLESAGSYAMSGLTAGINAGASSAIAAANSVANQVAATVRKALDIHSPSRVMMAVGGFVSAGLAKGITAAQNLVANASNRLATAAVPTPLADVSASGNVTSTMHLDQSEVEELKASSNQTVVVQHKQVVPQVVINVDNKDGEPIDTDALLQEFEDKIIELMDSDLE